MPDEKLIAFHKTVPNHGFYDPENVQDDAKETRKEKKNREESEDRTMQLSYLYCNFRGKPYRSYCQRTMTLQGLFSKNPIVFIL